MSARSRSASRDEEITMREPHRLLVIANETVEGTPLHDAIRARADEAPIEVLVVAPALNSRLRHWMSDEDAARRAAEERLVGCLQRLELAGVRPYGWRSEERRVGKECSLTCR